MDRLVIIFLLFLFYDLRGISQPFEMNFILEINKNLDCPPTKDLTFEVRFEDMPLKFIKEEYPFYAVEVTKGNLIRKLSLNLFYKGRQLEVPTQRINTFDNEHFRIQIDTCKIKGCLQIISYDTVQYQSIDCTIGNFPGLTIEILNPPICSGKERIELNDLVKNDSIPFATRVKLRKILASTFNDLESYYNSLSKSR